MSSQNHNDIIPTTNNNVIIIPYSDNQEESDTSIHINGFTIIELDEEKKLNNYLIHSFEYEQNIGNKKEIYLKSKAKIVENYYANYLEGVVPNVNCSKCLLDGFTSNELLYFKDRKTLISYLKYCFLYSRKSLFMNHNIYMNNKYDLFKINQSFYAGWKFGIPKTICKSCFIHIINKEYLIFNLKNIICDYDQENTASPLTNKNISTPSLINNKRRRLSLNKKRKIVKTKVNHSNQINLNDINGQISPIVIPISKNEKVHKKRRSSNAAFKRRKVKVMKKGIKTKYNQNIIYDSKNNLLIINKKSIPNYQNDNDSIIINSIINDNKKFNVNKDKEKDKDKNKEKEGEKPRKNKKKDEELIFYSNNINESELLSNKKIVKNEKKYDMKLIENLKDINGNKNKNNNLNNNSTQKIIENKSTIIINNINNNNNPEINMDKVGLIQINNNQFENNSLKNFSDNSTKNNINQKMNINSNNNNNNNNNNIFINNLNNNNYNYNNNYLNYQNISILRQLHLIPSNINYLKILEEIQTIKSYIIKAWLFAENLKKILEKNTIGNINEYKTTIYILIRSLEEIRQKVNETGYFVMNTLNIIKSRLFIYQIYFNDNNKYSFKELFFNFLTLEKFALDVQKKYLFIVEFFIQECNILRHTIDNIIG
jgi:hypothetical protein